MAETIKVKRSGPRGWHNISKASYDPAKHELYEPEAKPETVDDPMSIDEMTDDELRVEIEELTGEKPHHFTGRQKLIEQLSDLRTASQ